MTPDNVVRLTDRVGKQLAIAKVVKAALVVAAVGAILGVWQMLVPGVGDGVDMVVILAAAGVWVVMSMAAAGGARLILAAGNHTAAGRVDLAERVLVDAAMAFSLFPAQRLLAIQNLGALAHGAGDFAQAADLSRFVVDQSGRGRKLRQAFGRTCRLLLADSELMRGRLQQAYEQLQVLYADQRRLPEQLALLPVACYYEASVGSWDSLAGQATRRERLAQLLPPPQAAATLGCLALAFERLGKTVQRDWLWQQATLLVDRSDLVARLPLLEALSVESAMRLPWQEPKTPDGDVQ